MQSSVSGAGGRVGGHSRKTWRMGRGPSRETTPSDVWEGMGEKVTSFQGSAIFACLMPSRDCTKATGLGT